jgi:Fe-S-cluster containining protein
VADEEKPKVRLPIIQPDEAPLRDDMDDGLRFLHTMSMQMKHDLYEAQAKLFALVEELVSQDKIDLMSYEDRRQRIRERELGRQVTMAFVQLGQIKDKYALTELPDIDCASLIPICKARCCALTFALSIQDLDERAVEWDYRNPYQIRHDVRGRCVHQSKETGFCGVYEKRPGMCRVYDCRKDARIWKDFEKKIPNDDPLVVTGRARAGSRP